MAVTFCVCVCGLAAGDIRLELRGTDLLIAGKQAMTGGLTHALLVYTFGLLGLHSMNCRQQNGVSQPVTCWKFQGPLQVSQGSGHQQPQGRTSEWLAVYQSTQVGRRVAKELFTQTG